ncbi:dTDP-glucose 4,6-dehydratase [Mycolicibacterium smegmatis MKD8]|uniref:dTDP-glucose 4,6-dehydratase n=1 Tax=Mycolicibacterium smegmatis (strain MKD8) TaxID=1214915 RepID=A0A2U9PYJ1_MYCSE|nr:dTDP-glucose 4,6-dehydratase [Mycolicibacterium smegmatis MKD8]
MRNVITTSTSRSETWDWSRKTVLVTGATGFLGGALIRKLIDCGASVVGVVRRVRPDSQLYRDGLNHHVRIESGDVSDFNFMRRIFEEREFHAVFHTAYGADVNRVLNEPLECFRGNVQSTWQMLDLMRELQPRCVSVISSSDKAYGCQELPLRENKPLTPLHPYEVAKASQDLVTQSYGKVFNLPAVVTRCGNFFGPNDLNMSRVIPGTLERLSRGERPVLRSDGHSTRDFLYIEDAVDAQMLLAASILTAPALYGEAFNFSYGMQLEVIELVQRLIDLTGCQVTPVVAAGVKAEIPHLNLASDKAVELLCWRPSVGFEAGLKRTVAWYGDYFGADFSSIRYAGLRGDPASCA